MSSFACPVVTLPELKPHGNADTLSVVEIDGAPVCVKTQEFVPGETCVYIPVDAVIPVALKDSFSWLEFKDKPGYGVSARVKAVRLRGTFSMGFLTPLRKLTGLPPMLDIGDDLAPALCIKKYEEPENVQMGGDGEKNPPFLCPTYTDIESWRKPSFRREFTEGEAVVITEKVHGCNSRFCYYDGNLYLGSHTQFKRVGGDSIWPKLARQPHGAQEDLIEDTVLGRMQAADRSRKGIQGPQYVPTLEDRLKRIPGFIIYGEAYGWVQDLRYGMGPGKFEFLAFDAFDTTSGRYLNYEEFRLLTVRAGISTVPLLYAGPYKEELIAPLADGKSMLGHNIREGLVIRPQEERFSQKLGGRLILKLHGQDYLLRKGGSEHK